MTYARGTTFFLFKTVTALAALSILSMAALADDSVTLAWNPNGSGNIAGYHLYYGGSSRDYTNTVDAGSSTTVTVSNLAVGATYFFAVTDYDTLGLESDFSAEISYAVPATARLAASSSSRGQLLLIGQGPVGYGYSVQTSRDLQNWTVITNLTVNANGTFQYTDPSATTNSLSFYRLQQTSP